MKQERMFYFRNILLLAMAQGGGNQICGLSVRGGPPAPLRQQGMAPACSSRASRTWMEESGAFWAMEMRPVSQRAHARQEATRAHRNVRPNRLRILPSMSGRPCCYRPGPYPAAGAEPVGRRALTDRKSDSCDNPERG